MGRRKSRSNSKEHALSSSSSGSSEWHKIFNALVQMLKSQQWQLETLAADRELLEERIQRQQQSWLSDVQELENHVSQLQHHYKGAELERQLQAAKQDLLVGVKRRQAFLYKYISEQSVAELDDLKQVIDHLCHKISEQKDKSEERNCENDRFNENDVSSKRKENGKEQKLIKTLQDEIKRLKHSKKELSSQRNSEVSALVAERNFVWEQFKKMESEFTTLSKSKHVEVENANESILKLQGIVKDLQSSIKEKDRIITELNAERARLTHMSKCIEMDQTNESVKKLQSIVENLQSSSKEKDDIIAQLNAEKSILKMDMDKKDEERSRLSKELELLQSLVKSSSAPVSHSSPRKCHAKNSMNVKSKNFTTARKESSEFSQAQGPSPDDKNIIKLCNMENLQSSTSQERDDIPDSSLPSTRKERDDLILRTKLSKELKLPQSSVKYSSAPPATRSRLKKVHTKSAMSVKSERVTPLKRESFEFSRVPGPSLVRCRESSKRRHSDEASSKLDIPRLFNSGFKVPKLKIPSL